MTIYLMSLCDTTAGEKQIQTVNSAHGMYVGAEMRINIFFPEIDRCLLDFRAVPAIKTAEVPLKGAADIFQIIQERWFFRF